MVDASQNIWDVNRRNAGFWEPQMTLNVLQWLKEQKVYEPNSIKDALKKVLNKTLLNEYYQSIIGEPPPESRVQFAAELKETFIQLERRLEGFLSCMVTAGRQRPTPIIAGERKTIKEWQEQWKACCAAQAESEVENDGNSTKETDFPNDLLKLLIQYTQLFYAFGDHEICQRRLQFYLDTVCEFTIEARESTEFKLNCLWGMVSSMILTLPPPEQLRSSESLNAEGMPNYPLCNETSYMFPKYILLIDDLLENTKLSREHVVLSKVWLFHWSLWPLLRFYFVQAYPKELVGGVTLSSRQQVPLHIEWARLVDWMLSDKMLTLISTMCPQLLRYVAVIAILNNQRQDHFKAATDAIARASFRHSDLLANLLNSLFVKYNFEEAQEKLALCKEEAAADFLLEPLKEVIEEHARLLIFQTYCQIQKSIEIDTIGKKLHMTSDTAERWIVNLIRHARLEAKIDSERNCVEIASPSISVYQQIIEKTHNILMRTTVLLQSLDRYPTETTTNALVFS